MLCVQRTRTRITLQRSLIVIFLRFSPSGMMVFDYAMAFVKSDGCFVLEFRMWRWSGLRFFGELSNQIRLKS